MPSAFDSSSSRTADGTGREPTSASNNSPHWLSVSGSRFSAWTCSAPPHGATKMGGAEVRKSGRNVSSSSSGTSEERWMSRLRRSIVDGSAQCRSSTTMTLGWLRACARARSTSTFSVRDRRTVGVSWAVLSRSGDPGNTISLMRFDASTRSHSPWRASSVAVSSAWTRDSIWSRDAPRSRPRRCSRLSTIGWKAVPVWKGEQRHSNVGPSPASVTNSRKRRTSRDLPIPASPEISATCPRPSRACCQCPRRSASSRSLPINPVE